MSITMVASIQGADFDHWKALFDTLKNDRVATGIHAKEYPNVDDENTAIGIVTAPPKDALMTLFMLPESQEAMKTCGVLAPPDITLLEEV